MAKKSQTTTRVSVLPTWEKLLSRLYLLPENNFKQPHLRLEVLALISNPGSTLNELLSRLCVILPKTTAIETVAVIRLTEQGPVVECSNLSERSVKRILTTKSIARQLRAHSVRQRLPQGVPISSQRQINFFLIEPLGDRGGEQMIILGTGSQAVSSDENRLLNVVTQITRLKLNQTNLELTLKSQDTQLKILTHHLGEGMMILDQNLRVSLWNKPLERLTGFAARDFLGEPLGSVATALNASELAQERVEQTIKNPRLGHLSFDMEITCRKKAKRWLNLSGSIMRNSSGAFEQAILVIHDVSHAKSLEQKKNEFISIATHEFRTPLTVIKGYLSLLLKEGDQFNDRQQRYLARANEASNRLVRLSEELLQTIQVEQDRLQLTPQDTELYRLLKKISRDLKARASQKGLVITVRKPDFPTEVRLDPSRTEQIFTNLIDNALKYTARGSIKISFERVLDRAFGGEFLVTNVRDTGMGIAADRLEDIFEKFHRVHRLESVKEQGAGLGLFIVKSFVEKQGGKISVRSRPGQGTTFSVSFPLETNTVTARKKEKR